MRRKISQTKNEALKVVLLSNFTLRGLEECIVNQALADKIAVSVYEGAYGQWQQEALNDKLYSFEPDVVFILLDFFNVDNNLFFDYHTQTLENLREKVASYYEQIYATVKIIKRRTEAKVVISNFPVPGCSMLGLIDNKFSSSLHRLILEGNLLLEDYFMDDSQVFIFDLDNWLSRVGKDEVLTNKFFYLADLKIPPNLLPALGKELAAYLIPLAIKTKKCLVLDLDNTLWGGVVGEDGIGSIELSPTGKGQAFFVFQKLILALYERGVILAINSRNNPEDALVVLREHPYMILREKYFAAMRINWQDKATNMKELAEELNIGLDSFVFIDDDPTNQALIRELFPEIDVIELPSDPVNYLKILLTYRGFSSFEFTEEDRGRGKMYKAETERKKLQVGMADIESFLRSLEIQISIEPLNKLSLSRVVQLTQKTNQFNLTTHRYQEEDILKILNEGGLVWTVRVLDRFGDYGIAGLIIVGKQSDYWEIDTFLLSCRILGKQIEEQFLGYILNQLKSKNEIKVKGVYQSTGKNAQTKDFYGRMGFTRVNSLEEKDIWELDLKNYIFNNLDVIKIIQ